MTGQEIRLRIDENNKYIKENVDLTTWILQPEIHKYLTENAALQAKCPHEFDPETGICKYCDKKKEEEE